MNYDSQYSNQMNQNLFNPLILLLKELNPDLEIDYINNLIEESVNITSDYYLRVFSWFEKKYQELYKSKIDLREFLEYLGNFAFFHKKFSSKLTEIGTLLGLDKIETYPLYDYDSEM